MINKSNIYFPLNKPTGGSGVGDVQSVNGKIGTVVLTGSDINDDTLTTTSKNITLSINELNSNKENKSTVITSLASAYYNGTTSQYDVTLSINTEIYISDAITGTWNINFPATANAGEISSITATCNGDTAPTMVINSTFVEDDGIPSTTDKVEIIGKYDGSDWIAIMNRVAEVIA